jgi:hypothetical protein
MNMSVADHKDLFGGLEKQIRDLTQYTVSLLAFHHHLKQTCFDQEDEQFVLVKLQQAQQVKDGLERTLARKREIYDKQVRVMETQLSTRQQQLEGFGGANALFSAFPDVLEYFAKKQARLQESLLAIRQKLQET